MAFTVGDVLMAARDLNPAFTPQRHPDPVCWRFLTRYARTLTAEIAKRRPRALVQTVTSVPLPLPNFAVGTAVPNDLLLLDVVARPTTRGDDTVRVPVELVPAGQRTAGTTRLPYGWRDGNTLFLGGKPEQWIGFDLLELRTIAMPAAYTANAAGIAFPDDALDVFAAQLGAFLARRHADGPETTKFSPASLEVSAAQAQAQFIDRLCNQARAEVWTMRRIRD